MDVTDKTTLDISINAPSSPTACVSVVIPCFRCSRSIERAVASAAHQSLKPAEIILVDDASEDDTWNVLLKIESKYPELVRLLRLPKNQGPSGARNAGWNLARHPYIAFLDADDIWHPDKLRIQYRYMTENPNIAISGHQCMLLRENAVMPNIAEAFHASKISAISLIFKNCFSTPTVLLKRDIPFRFPEDRRYAEDLNLWQRIAFSGLPVIRIESPMAYLYKAHYGEGGLSAQLWNMEIGELRNLINLFKNNHINVLFLSISTIFSIAKFIRRLIVTWMGRCFSLDSKDNINH